MKSYRTVSFDRGSVESRIRTLLRPGDKRENVTMGREERDVKKHNTVSYLPRSQLVRQ